MSNEKPRYLVFDIETVADGRLIQRIRYPADKDMTPAQAIERYREQLLEQTGSDFIPHTFQLPVSIALVLVSADYQLIKLTSLDSPQFRPQVITKLFWRGWQHYGCPCFVTFNGRGFDIPVMELAAFRYGYPITSWFAGNKWDQARNRYNTNAHLDLLDLMSNFGGARINGGLNLCATLLGKPGKIDTKGDMVQDLWNDGEHQRIDNYCQCDALDTYFVFLRSLVMRGHISIDQEQDIVSQAEHYLSEEASENPALEEYLAHNNRWQRCAEDDWPFLDPNDATTEPVTD